MAVVLGLGVGSWLTVVGHRLPRIMEHNWRQQAQAYLGGEHDEIHADADARQRAYTLWRPSCHCARCEAPIGGWGCLPLVGWAFSRGQCAVCQGAIGWRYPITELVTAILFGLCAWHFGASVMALCAMGLCAALVLLAWIDLQTCLLPDVITLPLVWVGLLINLDGALVPLPSAVLGAVVGYLSLWLLFHMFRLITRREGMGYGDFKLFAALGAWFGTDALPVMLLVASLAGVLGALCLRAIGHAQRGQALPFGPYLALAGVVMLFSHGARPAWF